MVKLFLVWVLTFNLALPALAVNSMGVNLGQIGSLSQQGGSKNWEKLLDEILTSLKGPVVSSICAISIVVCGCAIMLGLGGSVAQAAARICLGASIATGGVGFVTGILGISSGALL